MKLVRGEQMNDPTALAKRRSEVISEEALRLVNAEQDSFVMCNDKTACDKSFSLAQIFVSSQASQKIQIATDTIVETYNPTENGSIGMKVTKIPGKGSSSLIRLTVICRVDDKRVFNKLCKSKKTELYNNFRPFISRMLAN